ncbi:MAG: Holliday junction branch migration protein RuvA [Ruminococcaceae bacterium]|nr:Holliday junction branch migration protein RuvA [Oscillospiraceae bacterium]
MFYSITGKVVYYDAQCVAVDCNGVAFNCNSTTNTLKNVSKKGETVTLYTYLNVREDALDLYGFSTLSELECFKLLLNVSSVGPKVALAVLSEFTPDKLAVCIASGDTKSITRANGVGNKVAQRIVLELKDKIAKDLDLSSMGVDAESVSSVIDNANTSEAVSALVMLGYSQSEAASAVGRLDPEMNVEELIKQALKNLSKIG